MTKKRDVLKEEEAAFIKQVEDVNSNLIVLNGAGTTLPSDPAADDPERIRHRIIYLRDTIDNAYFELAELLYRVWNGSETDGKPLYLAWGYSSWNEYVQKELDFALRKAQYLISIWNWFGVKLREDLGPKNEEVIAKVRPLGWTKVKELVNVVNQVNVNEWIGKARVMSSLQLADEAKRFLQIKKFEEEKLAMITAAATAVPEGSSADVSTGVSSDAVTVTATVTDNVGAFIQCQSLPRLERLHHISVGLYDEQLATVVAALERAKDLAHSDKKGFLLELICQDWLATNDAMKGTKKENAIVFLHKFEKLLGVKIIAFDMEAQEILCGGDLIEKLCMEEKSNDVSQEQEE